MPRMDMTNGPTASDWLNMQGAGGIMSAFSAFMGAQAQKTSLGFQAEIDSINATASERAAQAALLAGQRQEQQSMLATANMKSTQQAGFASHGVDLGEGSAARTLASTDVMGKIDANTIAANAVRSAWGYRTQATNYANSALMKSSAASSISPIMAAGTSLLGSATAVAGNWYMLNKAGAFDPKYAYDPNVRGLQLPAANMAS